MFDTTEAASASLVVASLRETHTVNTLRSAIQLILGTTLGNRAIGREVGIAFNTVRRYRRDIAVHGHDPAELLALDDPALYARFYQRPAHAAHKRMPDWSAIHTELQRPHMTLQLLWEEYCQPNPGSAYRYSQFTHLYRAWASRHRVSMRQSHVPGERGWVDFLGPTLAWVDPVTGETHRAQVFAAALGVSGLLFAWAVPSQTCESWIEAHNHWYAFLGGVPAITVPDNLKAAVLRAGPEPKLHPTYVEMARHYGTVILPARPRKPKDKAKAEGGVLILERWALAKLRDRVFHSLADINGALRACLDQINGKVMRQYGASRQARFDTIDRPKLLPLPATVFEFGEWIMQLRVGVDYCVAVYRHYYSVPHRLVRETVDVRVTAATMEIFHHRDRVAGHLRSHVVGGHTIDKAHLPKAHRAWADHTPEHYRAWAATLGTHVQAVVEHQFATGRHAALALKACSSLRRLAKTYEPARFDAACERALAIRSPTPTSIRSLLQNHLERLRPESQAEAAPKTQAPHANVRGASYYQTPETSHAD